MLADKVCISKPTCAEELKGNESAAIEQCSKHVKNLLVDDYMGFF
jgi:hypothetical protein